MLKTLKKALLTYSLLLLALAPVEAKAREAAAPKGAAAEITINFVDVEVSSLIRIMSEITRKNFIYDAEGGAKGRVTIVAPAKLTSDEAMDLFISALELKGFAVVPSGDAYKIIPSSLAKQSGMKVSDGAALARGDQYIVRLITLEYVSFQEALSAVQPLISRYGQVSSFGSKNALMVVDTSSNVEKILNILKSVDRPAGAPEPELVYLRHAQAEALVQILRHEEQRRTGPKRGPDGQSDSGISLDSRLNAIILSNSPVEREYYRRFISLLDVAPPEASSRLHVYYLENANSADLGKVLSSLLDPARAAAAEKGAPTQMPFGITGRISITPFDGTNSLIIMASPSDYRNLVQVIEKLDRRPKQVFVEAMITEVSIDKAVELGNRWRATGMHNGDPVVVGGFGTVDQSSIQSVVSGLAGLSIGGLGNFITVPVTRPDGTSFNLTAPGFAALFSLSSFRDVVNVLSTPHLLTSDNSEAEIMVGENVPFLSKLERETGTTGQPLIQSIERKDVGIKLRIKPKISEGDFVKLDIYQEISAISPTTVAGASDLITTKRSAQTSVVAKNNQTVVIGGLIQTRKTNSTVKVPLLGDIPLLGWLFKFKREQDQKTNLLVFITPYIVNDFQGLDELRMRKESEFDQNSRPAKPQGGAAP
ncbi:MAG: type II secretion system secretin GspD [Thermodesulfobacteriota bacterium]|nr:MAG: type II secretion system secretin GspD [Thermodesulfobacteriota bacterium]